MEQDADGLNPPQREAVEHGDGPLLILAGAGSGKTRVITHRLARLVERGIPPWRILAVTFTNKAAGEMRERAARLLGEAGAHKLWLGTFHSTCAKLLRIHAGAAGLQPNFQIYDDDDQKKLASRIMKEEGIGDRVTPRSMLSRIDQAKNEGITASEFVADDYMSELVARVYPEYQKRLREANAVDFGDLLVETLKLCDHPAAGPDLARRFSYVLVDEFQDTNRVQYRLVQKLAVARNLCVVGDDDQSIYRWRGADVRNILDFERDYVGCKVVKLEQNYRSTKTILEAANGVIARNTARKAKHLFTENDEGEPVVYFTASDERREAEFIVKAIRQLMVAEGREPGDFAVLYRMHAQSRALEEALRADNLPYKIFGGVGFFDRAEVKDLLAYLRVVAYPGDQISLERVVNVPPRGIGDTTLERVGAYARRQRISYWEAMEAVATGRGPRRAAPSDRPFALTHPGEQPPEERVEGDEEEVGDRGGEVLGTGPRKKLAAFVQLVSGLREAFDHGESLSELATRTLDESGLLGRLQQEGSPESVDRIANLEGLLNAIREYEREAPEPSLVGYLERVSLFAATDVVGTGVGLMTVHAAKGLEYPVVFIGGLEESTFPLLGERSGIEELEEERRLAYVAITRARERLILTNAARRRLFRGEPRIGFMSPPLDETDPLSLRESRFIGDIPAACIARPTPVRRGGVTAPRPTRRDDGSWIEREEPQAHADDDGEAYVEREPPARDRFGAPRPRPAAAPPSTERYVEYDVEAVAPGGIRIGQRVRHRVFGEGRVRKLSGSGPSQRFTIEFPTVGEKVIVGTKFIEPV